MSSIIESSDHALPQSLIIVLSKKMLPAMVCAGLGLVLLYGVAFANTSALHNAAHDGRHSAGFPCH